MKLSHLNLPRTTESTPLKVFSDISQREDGLVFAGWAFQNHNGQTLDISGDALGKGWGIIGAEAEAIIRALDGINHYSQVNHIKAYTDCEPAIGLLEEESVAEKFERYFDISFKWVPREKNKVADLAADSWMARHWSPPERELSV